MSRRDSIEAFRKFAVQFGDMFSLLDDLEDLDKLDTVRAELQSQAESAKAQLAEASKSILSAKAEADSIRSTAKAEADATTSKAQSDAEAIVSQAHETAAGIVSSASAKKEQAIADKNEAERSLTSIIEARDAAKAELSDLNSRIEAARKAAAAALGLGS